MNQITGYAVTTPDGGIDIKTISDTERAAKVNWLVIHGVPVWSWTTDEQISKAFEYMTKDTSIKIVPVGIAPTTNEQPPADDARLMAWTKTFLKEQEHSCFAVAVVLYTDEDGEESFEVKVDPDIDHADLIAISGSLLELAQETILKAPAEYRCAPCLETTARAIEAIMPSEPDRKDIN